MESELMALSRLVNSVLRFMSSPSFRVVVARSEASRQVERNLVEAGFLLLAAECGL